MSIGNRIKQIRTDAGLSRKDFAARIGVSEHLVYDVERGRQRTPVDFARRVSEQFRKNLTWLITGEAESELGSSDSEKGAACAVREESNYLTRTYLESERSDSESPTVPIPGDRIGTDHHDPTVPLDLEGPVDLRMVRLVVELAEAWLEEVQKAWTPAKKAEAYCILAQLAESLRTSGLGDDAIRDQIRPLLRIVTAQ